jgi:glycogen debranching enzyme
MTLGRGEIARTIDPLEREWLVTNGLGGFAQAWSVAETPRLWHSICNAEARCRPSPVASAGASM